ncbi:MAG: glycoside hydrolase family 127 protein [Phycisphaerae bacterium]|nr:glycoside hydrolase family 127 protein [Phycisphaerae bacterium]
MLVGTMLAVVALGGVALAAGRGAVETSPSPHAKLRSVPMDAVKWTTGFWTDKYNLCRSAMIPTVRQGLANAGNAAVLGNFRVAAGLAKGKHLGRDWGDGDCYKYLETLAHVYAATRDQQVLREMDKWIAAIAKAQADDGYISTNIQLTSKQRFTNTHHHELYNMGHLLTAACIHHRATGKDSFLKVAQKLGDFLYKTFQPRPAKLAHYGWNPSNIMGLAELYRTTGDRRYLELAGIFVDMRGSAKGGSDLTQDHVPLRKETEGVGHCVCATDLDCGAADVVAETGDKELLKALERIWRNVTQRRMYITGAVGSLPGGKSTRGDSVHEAFGADYELPTRTAYNETCANIGNAMWNYRMLMLTGEARYADVMERVLYNSMLSAVGVDGKGFFYCNPLKRTDSRAGLSKHHTAQRWAVHRGYCCPPQVIRTIAKLHGWAYSVSGDGLWVHLYGGSVLATKLPGGRTIKLTQETDYPWSPKVTLTVNEAGGEAMAIRLRIPGWAEGASVKVNGCAFAGPAKPGSYATIRRKWAAGDVIELDLPMPVRLMEANPKVKSLRNYVAVMRGPVVYCLELPKQEGGEKIWREGVFLPAGVEFTPQLRKDFLGGVVVLKGQALTFKGRDRFVKDAADAPAPKTPADWGDVLYRPLKGRAPKRPKGGTVEITLVPYYAWANQGLSLMEVWIPLARQSGNRQ